MVKQFFVDAEVIWVEQSTLKPKPPYITLKIRNITKNLHPIGSDAGKYYACATNLEVNLYTKGRPVTNDNFENTAEDDLLEFVKYLESDAMLEAAGRNNIAIQLLPPVRDLTELYHENTYRYRAYAEFAVSYMEDASGRYGLGTADNRNYSGGSNEYRNQEDYVIEKVEIEEESYER